MLVTQAKKRNNNQKLTENNIFDIYKLNFEIIKSNELINLN